MRGLWLMVVGCAALSVAAADDAPSPVAKFNQTMDASMTRMMRAMHDAPVSHDPDRDFLAMMIPHHQGAVDMARLVLVHGRDPLVRRLAEEIMASQQAEIAAMRARLAILERGPDPAPGGFPAIHGTRGE